MSDANIGETIELVPVERIRVLNPRQRNRRVHLELVRSIESVGLKRPITVCLTNDASKTVDYDLVCGQVVRDNWEVRFCDNYDGRW
jgi:ParB family chromosome partitioning protein